VSTEPPTPRTTGSWNAFRDAALKLARRLERAAVALKSPNPLLYDPESAGRALERAELLRWLADQFEMWPTDPEKANFERGTLGPLLLELQRKSEESLTRMQGGPW
jgi:hypothetical protein